MSQLPAAIPTDWQVVLSDPGTAAAAWVLIRNHDGVGVIAEARLPASTTTPDAAVAAWVADSLEVTGTVLQPTETGVWSVQITA